MADGHIRTLARCAAAAGDADSENFAWLRERARHGSTLQVTHVTCDGNGNCKREPTGEWRDYTVTLGLLCCCGETEDAHGLGGMEHSFVHVCAYYNCLDECECEPYEETRRRQIFAFACIDGRFAWQWFGDYCRLALAAYCNYKPAQLLVPHSDSGDGKTGWEYLNDAHGYPDDRWMEVLFFHAKDWPQEVLLRAAVASARAVIKELCDPASAAHRSSHVSNNAHYALDCADAFLVDQTEEKREVWRQANTKANIGTSVDWLPCTSKVGKPRNADLDTVRAAIAITGARVAAAAVRVALLKWCLHG